MPAETHFNVCCLKHYCSTTTKPKSIARPLELPPFFLRLVRSMPSSVRVTWAIACWASGLRELVHAPQNEEIMKQDLIGQITELSGGKMMNRTRCNNVTFFCVGNRVHGASIVQCLSIFVILHTGTYTTVHALEINLELWIKRYVSISGLSAFCSSILESEQTEEGYGPKAGS